VSPGAKLTVDITWTWPVMIALLALAMLPVWGPLLPPMEGFAMPVTSKVTFVQQTPVEGGLHVRMSYTKNRDCEILGLSMDREGVPIDFEPVIGSVDNLVTKGTGTQVSRLWFVGDEKVDGLRLRFLHRCHPWFITVTTAYP